MITQENGVTTAGQAQAVIGAAKKSMSDFDMETVCDMNEVEMAAAIGRLVATLGMLIAAVTSDRTGLDD